MREYPFLSDSPSLRAGIPSIKVKISFTSKTCDIPDITELGLDCRHLASISLRPQHAID